MTKLIKNKSFTLIETLIVVGIIITLSGLTLATYNDFNSKQSINKEASQLTDVMELARKDALAGRNTCVSPQILSGYQVNIVNGTPIQYNFKQCCSGICGSAIQTYYFSRNLTVPAISILFKPLSQGTSLSGDTSISLTKNGLTIKLCVYTNGSLQQMPIGVDCPAGFVPGYTPTPAGPTLTPTPSLTPTVALPTSTPTLTPTSTPSLTPTATSTPTSTPTPSLTPTPTPILSPCFNFCTLPTKTCTYFCSTKGKICAGVVNPWEYATYGTSSTCSSVISSCSGASCCSAVLGMCGAINLYAKCYCK